MDFFGSDNILVGAERWKDNITAAREAMDFGPQDYIEVRYEDMLASGEGELRKLFDFCHLPYTDELVSRIIEASSFDRMKKNQTAPDHKATFNQKHFNKGQANVWKQDMSAYDRYIFNYIAGPLLTDIGYAEKGWWKKSLNSITGPLQFFLVRVQFRLNLMLNVLLKGNRG
jgi:hypothetical protein